MEKRTAKVNFSMAGGTAARGSKTCKIALPNSWINSLGINESQRTLELSYTGSEIIISRCLTGDEFVEQKIGRKHDVKIYNFYDENVLCSTIYADFSDNTLVVENHVQNPVKTAFGNNLNPTWSEFLSFLEERCIPRQRDGLREYLETLGLDEYSPIDIIKKTFGRSAEDNQWLEEKAVS